MHDLHLKEKVTHSRQTRAEQWTKSPLFAKRGQKTYWDFSYCKTNWKISGQTSGPVQKSLGIGSALGVQSAGNDFLEKASPAGAH